MIDRLNGVAYVVEQGGLPDKGSDLNWVGKRESTLHNGAEPSHCAGVEYISIIYNLQA